MSVDYTDVHYSSHQRKFPLVKAWVSTPWHESRMGFAVAFLLPRLKGLFARKEIGCAISGDKWLAVEQWVFPTLLAITDGSRQVEERRPESR